MAVVGAFRARLRAPPALEGVWGAAGRNLELERLVAQPPNLGRAMSSEREMNASQAQGREASASSRRALVVPMSHKTCTFNEEELLATLEELDATMGRDTWQLRGSRRAVNEPRTD